MKALLSATFFCFFALVACQAQRQRKEATQTLTFAWLCYALVLLSLSAE